MFSGRFKQLTNLSKAGRSILHHQNIRWQNRILHFTQYKLFLAYQMSSALYIRINKMYLSLRHIALMILLCRHEKKLYNNLCLHQILVIYSHTNNRKHVIVIQSFPIYRTDSFTEIKGLVCTSDFVYLCLSQRFILFVLFVFINNIGALERLSSILCYMFL